MRNYADFAIKPSINILAESLGVTCIHFVDRGWRDRKPIFIKLLQAVTPVVIIEAHNISPVKIKQQIADLYGSKTAVVLDCFDDFPDIQFLEYAATKIEGPVIIVNRKFKYYKKYEY
jgi:hypothetical protein